MALQESGEMYLETILILSGQGGPVRSTDIASYMNYSKPSVSRAVGLLKKDKLIEMDRDGEIHLTPSGLAIAQEIYERHTLLSRVLMHLGVDEETAIQDACKIEHDISETSFSAIKAFASKLLEKKD